MTAIRAYTRHPHRATGLSSIVKTGSEAYHESSILIS